MECYWCHKTSDTFTTAVEHTSKEHIQNKIAIIDQQKKCRFNFNFTLASVTENYLIVPDEQRRTVALKRRPNVEPPPTKRLRRENPQPQKLRDVAVQAGETLANCVDKATQATANETSGTFNR